MVTVIFLDNLTWLSTVEVLILDNVEFLLEKCSDKLYVQNEWPVDKLVEEFEVVKFILGV